jgi:hypothetical protein
MSLSQNALRGAFRQPASVKAGDAIVKVGDWQNNDYVLSICMQCGRNDSCGDRGTHILAVTAAAVAVEEQSRICRSRCCLYTRTSSSSIGRRRSQRQLRGLHDKQSYPRLGSDARCTVQVGVGVGLGTGPGPGSLSGSV